MQQNFDTLHGAVFFRKKKKAFGQRKGLTFYRPHTAHNYQAIRTTAAHPARPGRAAPGYAGPGRAWPGSGFDF